MALVTKKTAAAAGGGVAALGGGAYGIVKATEKDNSSDDSTTEVNNSKIKSVLSEDLLPTDGDGFKEEWKSLADKLTKETTTEDTLKTIKEEENKASDTDKGNKLKAWCQSQVEQYSKEEEILNLVKKWCVYTIEGKKTENELANFEDKNSEGELYFLILKLHKFTPENELTKEFKKARSSVSLNTNDNWGELKKYCEETYKRGYAGKNGKVWTQFQSFCYKPTIEDKLLGTTLPISSDLDNEWVEKVKVAKSSEIDEIKGEVANSDENKNKEALKKWCQNQYSKKYDETSKNNKSLFIETKKLCSLTIKEKLDSKKVLSIMGQDNRNEWEKNLNKLKTDNVEGNHSKIEELKEIKKGGENIDWEDLRNLCGEIYEDGYKGENDDLWKLANKYCTKQGE